MTWWHIVLMVIGGIFVFCLAVVLIVFGAAWLADRWENPRHYIKRGGRS